MSAELVGLILAWLACSVKFAIAYPGAIVSLGLDLPQAIIFGFTGGGVGVVAFTFAGPTIIRVFNWILIKLKISTNTSQKKKVFTPARRRLVKIKQRFGLPGIAFLSPILISIPVGCLVAVRFYHNKQKILRHMLGAVLFWSVFIAVFRDGFVQLVSGG